MRTVEVLALLLAALASANAQSRKLSAAKEGFCWVFAMPNTNPFPNNEALLAAVGMFPSAENQAIANGFCQSKGYKVAVNYVVQPYAGWSWPAGTISLDGATTCSKDKCPAFLYIVCGKHRGVPATCANGPRGNIGFRNSGSNNIGNWNTGNGNVGDANEGNSNVGNLNAAGSSGNVGHFNSGSGNTGNMNDGQGNTGDLNQGQGNKGTLNVGQGNTGYNNIGQGNTGSQNLGQGNTGYQNNGAGNTGNQNSGQGNMGASNSGQGNTGCGLSGTGLSGSKCT